MISSSKLSNHQKNKLLSTAGKPANFFSFIKDHKNIGEAGFPIRPIASVRRTPVEKADWLLAQILKQLIKYIPSHLFNSNELKQSLLNIELPIEDNTVFISLDVVNLYPSIPILKGIEYNLCSLREHWSKLNTYGINIDQIESLLHFVSFNYEIQYSNKYFKQVQGVPMGSHFDPLFAIVFMHHVESEALSRLNFTPTVYKRYVDDVILGPLAFDEEHFFHIRDTFNSIMSEIKFTLEFHKPGEWLPFLDLKVKVDNNQPVLSYYRKECHSDIWLDKSSFIPSHVKRNFLVNKFKTIRSNSSQDNLYEDSKKESYVILRNNGFSHHEISTAEKSLSKEKKSNNQNKNQFNLKLPFLGDRCTRKINRLITKYDIPIRLINMPGKKLAHNLNKKPNTEVNACNCSVCITLKNKEKCTDRFIVYKYTCNFCEEFYIGKTCRPFITRHKEHANHIKNKNTSSALSEHLLNAHSNGSIEDFRIDFISKLTNARDTAITEAKSINKLKPTLNRKHELTSYSLTSQFHHTQTH